MAGRTSNPRQPAVVTFLPCNTIVAARTGDTLLDAALDGGIDLPHECGGNCSCTTCHARILSGERNLSPMEPPERDRLEDSALRTPESRLACQALLTGGPVVAVILFDTSAQAFPLNSKVPNT